MSISADLYLEQIQKLLPRGAAWPRDPDATLTRSLWYIAESLARIDGRADVLIDNSDPRTTFEMLADWESMAGLPDPCAGAPETLQGRQSALVSRIVNQGGASPQFFIDLAESLGFKIQIKEYRFFRVSTSRVGQPLVGEPAAYTWTVFAGQAAVTKFRTGISTAGEPLGSIARNLALECAIIRAKPAHTTVRFNYTGSVPTTEIELAPVVMVSTATHPVRVSMSRSLQNTTLSSHAQQPLSGRLTKTLAQVTISSTGTHPLIPFDLDDGNATFVADVYLDGGTATTDDTWDVDGGNASN